MPGGPPGGPGSQGLRLLYSLDSLMPASEPVAGYESSSDLVSGFELLTARVPDAHLPTWMQDTALPQRVGLCSSNGAVAGGLRSAPPRLSPALRPRVHRATVSLHRLGNLSLEPEPAAEEGARTREQVAKKKHGGRRLQAPSEEDGRSVLSQTCRRPLLSRTCRGTGTRPHPRVQSGPDRGTVRAGARGLSPRGLEAPWAHPRGLTGCFLQAPNEVICAAPERHWQEKAVTRV